MNQFNQTFGVNWSEWMLSIVGGVIILIISSFISRIYKRLETIETAMPKRMEQYQLDQAQRQQKLQDELQGLRQTIGKHGEQLSAIRAQLDHAK